MSEDGVARVGAGEPQTIKDECGLADDDSLPLVSLFCVHGIGMQADGQTAGEVREATHLGLTALGGTHRPSTATPVQGVPAAIEDVVTVAGMTLRLRYRDGWWDERAVMPSAWRVLLWVFRVAPFSLWGTATLWMTDLAAIASAKHGRRDGFPVPLLAFSGLALAIVGAPTLMLIGLPLLSASLILPPTRQLAQRILQRYIGDAWNYRSDQLDEEVIGPMRGEVAAERDAADVVVLVGHSQGAEIARRVALTELVDGHVWVGSGEAQLGMLRTLRRSRLLPYLLWPYLIVFPALFTWSFTASLELLTSVFTAFLELLTHPTATTVQIDEVMRAASDALLAGVWPSTLPQLTLGAVTIGMGLMTAKAARHPADVLQQPNGAVLVVKSLIDPVCFGTSNENAVVRYVALPKKRHWIHQHMRYFTSPTTGIAILESLFGTNPLGVTPKVPTLGKRASFLGACAAVLTGTATLLVGFSEWQLLHQLH
ncbi:hypothetical protein DEI96_001125 [Curtobacterium sp. MCLR17_031]|uniref:hypothetical protein n=1 Tax=Curtobacterium sp. MCLR17_031 TaxID=2175622 RepID=UPI0011B6AB90|nr:hypothetical protein [Curtobacterium sp. MCLR17_031]WIE58244.1 hypothetical protein DEI96_001125 [Curtobacterium sp. MCLR17_031]